MAGLPNLALYLSVDAENTAAAQVMTAKYGVRLALCAEDYKSARELVPDRPALVCPENEGRMDLMTDGKGACVTCRLCVEGKRDVLFSTSHREDINGGQLVLWQPTRNESASREVSLRRLCRFRYCRKPLPYASGRGRRQEFCENKCRWAEYRLRKADQASTPSQAMPQRLDLGETQESPARPKLKPLTPDLPRHATVSRSRYSKNELLDHLLKVTRAFGKKTNRNRTDSVQASVRRRSDHRPICHTFRVLTQSPRAGQSR